MNLMYHLFMLQEQLKSEILDLRRIKNLTDEDILKSIKKYKRAWDELKKWRG